MNTKEPTSTKIQQLPKITMKPRLHLKCNVVKYKLDNYRSVAPKYVHLIKQYYNSEAQKIKRYVARRLRRPDDDRQRQHIWLQELMRDWEKLLDDISSTLDFYYFRGKLFHNNEDVNYDDDELLEMLDF